MAVERKFVQQGLNKARIGEYFTEQLDRAGYAGMEINRTPVGTQVRVFAEKPGMVIGKGGKLVRRLTSDLSQSYGVDNPQIEVQNVDVPELNAQLMASRLASALERGWYFRKAAHSTLRRIMESGALGCRIVLAGKLTGPRSRIEKIVEGYIVHAGKPAEEIVHHGFSTAVRKLGTIGCSIQIVLPGTVLPDVFNLVEVEPPEPAVEEEPITVDAFAPDVPSEIEEAVTGETGETTATEELGTGDATALDVADVAPAPDVVEAQPDVDVPDVDVPDAAMTSDADVDVIETPRPDEVLSDAQSPVETKGIPDEIGDAPETIPIDESPQLSVPESEVEPEPEGATDAAVVGESALDTPRPDEPTPDTQSPVETKGIPDATGETEDKSQASVEAKGAATGKAEVRNVGGKWEHKHDGIDWHVMTIVHADGE